MRFAIVFGILGVALTGLAVHMAEEAAGIWWLVVALEAYFAACFVMLAWLYGLRQAGLPVEDCFRRRGSSSAMRAILFPYLVLAGITLYLSRRIDREDMMNPVAEGIYVGRLPFPADRARVIDAGVAAVLNLCWEFPRHSGFDRARDVQTEFLPILDGSAPSSASSSRRWTASADGEPRGGRS